MKKFDVPDMLKEHLLSKGMKYTVEYLEMFGLDNPLPGYQVGNKKHDEMLKVCVEGGHPWDYYYEIPEGAKF